MSSWAHRLTMTLPSYTSTLMHRLHNLKSQVLKMQTCSVHIQSLMKMMKMDCGVLLLPNQEEDRNQVVDNIKNSRPVMMNSVHRMSCSRRVWSQWRNWCTTEIVRIEAIVNRLNTSSRSPDASGWKTKRFSRHSITWRAPS